MKFVKNTKLMTIAQAVKKSTGQPFTKYCKDVLKVNYKSFQYRLKNGMMKIAEVNQIIQDTGLSYEQLFMSNDMIDIKPPKPKEAAQSQGAGEQDEKSMGGQNAQQDNPPPIIPDQEEPQVNFGDLY